MRLISEDIQVTTTRDERGLMAPASFTRKGREYRVVQVLRQWVDAGFTPGERHKTWLTRRHRNVFRVLCDDDRIYEIYLDRSGGRRVWHLVGALSPGGNDDRA